ncbi:hypothetical protein BCR35DRAFT_301507 [Leucosporidium creatinivorum]|uniref:N-acetylglucosaminylphosphatidylinositol deacetylase n=1 Tax=Leucosporidium creatinivorum TaxID=106004 RepID=A0A1Y2FYI7_9BASI|nr:hypothetical protein BCR35DRAFT_301507 [Leucosporidium creatinivorum]
MLGATGRCCWLLLLLLVATARSQVFNCVGGSIYIVAHADDDLLFASPSLLADTRSGCTTTIILTGGDSGSGVEYAESRENGNEAAKAWMADQDDVFTEFNATFGGKVVLVRTLVGSPGVQNVYFKFPDGNMDGSGFSVTGYQSLRSLYFGNINAITSLTGVSWSLTNLRSALGQIITARQPEHIKTLDHLSDFDAGDHSDHLTTGRIASSLVATYAPSASFAGFMGYPVSNLAPTLSTTSADYQDKLSAFFEYAPYDSNECQSLQDCKDQGRGEVSWLQRQYEVTPDLRTTSTVGSSTEPVTLPPGVNVAGSAKATASSVESTLTPAKSAIDGVIGGYPGNEGAEWSSSGGGVGSWLKLTWTTPQNVSAIVLYDKPNLVDWLQAGTLTFSGGVKLPFTIATNDGTATVVAWPKNTFIVTTSVLLTATAVSPSTENVGLSEILVMGVACPGCTATKTTTTTKASSTKSSSTSTSSSKTSSLSTSSSASLSSSFSTTTSPSASPSQSSSTVSRTSASSSSSSSSTSSSTSSATGPVQTSGNLALLASASASSSGSGQGPEKAIDGFSGVKAGYREDGTGTYTQEWASAGQGVGATLTLKWPSPVTLTQLVLFDRPNLNDRVTGSTITFGGVTTSVSSLTNDGSGDTVTFASALTGDTLVFKVTSVSATTSNIGLSEIQAYFVGPGAGSITSSTLSSSSSSSSATSTPTSTTRSTSTSTSSSSAPAATGNLALLATASASSSGSGQGPEKAIDGFAGPYAGYRSDGAGTYTQEWASAGQGVGATLTLKWSSTVTLSQLVLYDRPNSNDRVTGASVTFGGSTLTIPSLTNDGTGVTVNFASPVSGDTLVFKVTSVSSSTSNVGLSEIQCFSVAGGGTGSTTTTTTQAPASSSSSSSSSPSSTSTSSSSSSTSTSASTSSASSSASASPTNLALQATASASSFSPGQEASKAIDGVINGYKEDGTGSYSNEWASDHESDGATLTLTWSSPITASTVKLFDRPNLVDQIASGTISFGGSTIPFGELTNDGSGDVFSLGGSLTGSKMVITVGTTSYYTSNVGLAEVQVW